MKKRLWKNNSLNKQSTCKSPMGWDLVYEEGPPVGMLHPLQSSMENS